MTDEEKWFFDLNGWLVRPGVLSDDETASIAEQVRLLHQDKDALPPEHRSACSGPSAVLIDHPQIVDVISEVISPSARLEGSFSTYRTEGRGEQELHGGRAGFDPMFQYRTEGERIFAGPIRVVTELAPVNVGDGGTAFISGSHKQAFRAPQPHGTSSDGKLKDLVRSYSCPAGSIVFFCENLIHGGQVWRGERPRIAILSLYNHLCANTHRFSMPPEVMAGLPLEKQAWFRPVWIADYLSQPSRMNTIERYVKEPEEPMNFPLHETAPTPTF